IQPYLDKDADYKTDILADVPENVMDLYRDKPAAQGGTLYGLPPDSNCQLQYYRSDVFDKAGVSKPADTWDEAGQIAQELVKGRTEQTGEPVRRGLLSGAVIITIMRCYGGDWFDKLEKGYYNPTLNSDAGHASLDIIMKLKPSLEDSSLNASDDESNP